MLLRENPTEDEWCQISKSLANKGSGQAVGLAKVDDPARVRHVERT
jgi:hypothetical protein